MLKIFIGYDKDEIVAYHTLCQSILETSSQPVAITPINLRNLKGVYTRERNSLQSTEFSMSRFLTPWLSDYQGWSLFMDCDMLVRADVAELFALADPERAVMVCKHVYEPRDEVKFLGNTQSRYAKKNWSSVMLFNNALCRALTPDYVNTATGLELHQFKWLAGDELIGDLPLEWNWLVDEYPYNAEARNAHFTRGGPYFTDYQDADYGDEWRAARDRTFSVTQR